MKAIVLERPGEFAMVDAPDAPPPAEGEVRVAVRRIGICGTDLHAFGGRQPFIEYPRILGHELGVEVLDVGPGVTGVRPGDQAAVEPYLHCGRCIACRRGRTNCCTTLRVLGVHTDGGMRERITVPAEKLHISRGMTLEQLALVETLGIGAHAVARAAIEPGEQALVVGAGPIGLTAALFAGLAGARVSVLDTRADRLDFCRRHLPIEQALTAGDAAGTLAQIEEITGGDLPTVVFDATGSASAMRRSFDYVAHGGRLVLVGLVRDDIAFADPHFHRREMTLLATRNATAADFTRIIGLIEAGRIDTTPWITHRAAFEQMIAAFPAWLDPDNRVVKAMVEVG
jgi:2-desacetyl-2-hydroxyethyl bacteriochlorophyllide A dehydrogenase